MVSPTIPRIEADELRVIAELGVGGQGRVFSVRQPPPDGTTPMAFKEYLTGLLPRLDSAALDGLVGFFHEVDEDTRQWLAERTAWPETVVVRAGSPCGFLMRLAPPEFIRNLHMPHGHTTQLLGLEYLLNSVDYMAARGIRLSDRDRLLIVRDLAATLARLHDSGIVVGDLSPKNVAVSLVPQPRCFLLDCDAVRLRGASVLDQAETPDWEVPAGEGLATVDSDRYKLALLALRLLAGDQSTRDGHAVPAAFAELAGLVRRSLAGQPSARPTLAEWIAVLDGESPTASTALPPRLSPVPPVAGAWATAPGPGAAAPMATAPMAGAAATPTARRGRWWVPALVALLVLGVCGGIAFAQRSPQQSDNGSPAPGIVIEQETPAMPTQEPVTPPTTVGIVDFSAVASDRRAMDVARMLDAYFSGINDRDYDTAIAVFDPQGPVDPSSAKERTAFIDAVSTSRDSDVRLISLGTGTASPVVLTTAQVTFRSAQAPGYGPKTDKNETCTVWDVTYSLTEPTAGEYRIRGSQGAHRPC